MAVRRGGRGRGTGARGHGVGRRALPASHLPPALPARRCLPCAAAPAPAALALPANFHTMHTPPPRAARTRGASDASDGGAEQAAAVRRRLRRRHCRPHRGCGAPGAAARRGRRAEEGQDGGRRGGPRSRRGRRGRTRAASARWCVPSVRPPAPVQCRAALPTRGAHRARERRGE